MSKIEIELKEAKEVFLLLEELQDFMHQPMNYERKEDCVAFIKSVYPEVRKSYYETVWNWLPEQVQKEIEQR